MIMEMEPLTCTNPQCDEGSSEVVPTTCQHADKCVAACAAYGRVCPCASRAAGKAACEKTLQLLQDSKVFKCKPEITDINAEDLVMGQKLGEGGFSCVNDCHMKGCDKTFAVKYLKQKIMVDVRNFKHGASDLAAEAFFLGSLEHPNIVKLHGVTAGSVDTNVSSGKECGFFILVDKLVETVDQRIVRWKKEEEEQSHSLLHRLTKEYKENQKLRLRERVKVALDIAKVMEYLHSLNIAFRDLKPDNIGFDSEGTLKVFDFGLAKEEKSSNRDSMGKYNMTGQTGSRRYMAPEGKLYWTSLVSGLMGSFIHSFSRVVSFINVLTTCFILISTVAKEHPYDKSVDVYSFGILLWELCSLEKPFNGYTSKKHMSNVVLGGERPKMDSSHTSNWPIQLQHLTKNCWSASPDSRPPFTEIRVTLEKLLESTGIEKPSSMGSMRKASHGSSDMKPSSEMGFGAIKKPGRQGRSWSLGRPW
jgi:serine/threonine protein kinase